MLSWLVTIILPFITFVVLSLHFTDKNYRSPNNPGWNLCLTGHNLWDFSHSRNTGKSQGSGAPGFSRKMQLTFLSVLGPACLSSSWSWPTHYNNPKELSNNLVTRHCFPIKETCLNLTLKTTLRRKDMWLSPIYWWRRWKTTKWLVQKSYAISQGELRLRVQEI